MEQIEIPFSKKMETAIWNAKKICTSRNEKKGEIGDRFELSNLDCLTLQIVDIQEHPLSYVRDVLYRLEGTESPEDFEKLWRSLHRGHFNPDKIVYVHFFTKY